MKHMLTTLLLPLFLFSSTASAQITIEENNYMPPVGTILKTAATDIDAATYESMIQGSGGGHLWNFSAITFDERDSTEVVNVLSSPVPGSFPDANLCTVGSEEGDSIWFYAKSVTDSYTQLGNYVSGSGGEVFLTVYEDLAPDAVFPITDGSSWVSHRYWTMNLGPGLQTNHYDTTFYEVDAYGEVKYGNRIEQCLRLRATQRSWTEQIVPGLPTTVSLTTTEWTEFLTSSILEAFGVRKITTGQTVNYRAFADVSILDQATAVVEFDVSILPDNFKVGQNYPNPFNPATSINYALPRPAEVGLDIINVTGRIIKHFDLGQQPAGRHTVTIDLLNEVSRNLASGVYFYRLSAGDLQATRKMLLLK